MAESLKDQTISGLKWSGIEKIFHQVFIFVSGILLARMLDIEDYGMITVLSIFMYLANALQTSGLPQALISKKDVSEKDYNTTFYFNIGVSFTLYIILFVMAPQIAVFYEKPQLSWLARYIFLSSIFNAIGAVQHTQLTKSINYRIMAKFSIISMFVSYLIALILACNGFGVWALATQIVLSSFLKNILLWFGNKWRPQLIFSWTSFKSLFGFGSSLLFKSILDTVNIRLTPNIIGKYLGFHSAGIYENGNRLYGSGFDFLSGTILTVSYPVMSKTTTDEELKRVFRKITRATSFLVFPFFFGMILVAKPFILSFLGVRWEESVQVLRLLSLCGIFLSFNYLFSNVIKVKGRTSYILITEIIYTIIIFSTLFSAVYFKWSMFNILLCIILANSVSYSINFFIVRKLIGYTVKQHFKDIIPYLLISLLSLFGGYLINLFITNYLFLFITQLVMVVILYFGITYLSGSVIIKELMSILKKKDI